LQHGKSAILRQNAANCAELAAAVEKEPAKNRCKRMEAAWLALAGEQDWLDGHVPPVDSRPQSSTGA
jgi:hypothetical protein